jgi:hypothetical protein
MQEALQRAAAPPASATPEATPSADATAAPATEAPADPAKPPAVESPTPEPAKGPIPFERHQSALDNARKKAAEAAQATFVKQYGSQLQVVQQLTSNPDVAIPQLYAEWRQSKGLPPEMDASDAGRALAARRGQTTPASMPEPDLVGTDGSGRQVAFYSAEQLARRDAWAQQQMLSQFRQEFAPIQQEYAQTKADREQQARVEQVRTVVGKTLTTWRDKPGFKEHEAEIKVRQAELVDAGEQPLVALGLAYAEIVPSRLASRTQASTQQSFVQQAAQKIAGSQNNPGQVAPAPPRRPRNPSELAKLLAGA